jgi:hypothetical protein
MNAHSIPTRPLIHLAIAASLVLTATMPAQAQTASVSTVPSATTQRAIGHIPQTAGVVIQMPMNLVIDVGQKQEVPYTVPLAQPLYDSQGNEVVPAQTPVSIKLKPENGGAKIVAEAIVVRGQMIPIQAMTAVVPGRTITEQSGEQRAKEKSAVMGNLFGAIGGAASPLSKRADAFEHAGMIGGAVGILSGLSSPKNYRIVEFTGGQVYVLQLQAPITLPALALAPQTGGTQPAGNQPAGNPANSAEKNQFQFRNVTQYSEGLEGVIKAFKAGQVSLAEARQIITAADQYATQTLTPKLFPPAGIRRQVQQLFDYTYEIDRK